VLSPGTGLSCPRHRRDARHHRRLGASVGASGPHGLAVRESDRSSAFSRKMLRPLAATAPRLHVRDDRDTSLCTRRDARRMRLIWGPRKAEYFSRDIWTGGIDLKAWRKLAFWCKSFRQLLGGSQSAPAARQICEMSLFALVVPQPASRPNRRCRDTLRLCTTPCGRCMRVRLPFDGGPTDRLRDRRGGPRCD
jgi:hypothetical protein